MNFQGLCKLPDLHSHESVSSFMNVLWICISLAGACTHGCVQWRMQNIWAINAHPHMSAACPHGTSTLLFPKDEVYACPTCTYALKRENKFSIKYKYARYQTLNLWVEAKHATLNYGLSTNSATSARFFHEMFVLQPISCWIWMKNNNGTVTWILETIANSRLFLGLKFKYGSNWWFWLINLVSPLVPWSS